MIKKALMDILGLFVRYVYLGISNIGSEPENISYLAMSIVVATIIYNLLLIPITKSQLISQEKMRLLQPELQKLQNKYRNQPELLNDKVRALYKKYDYKMSSSCLSTLAMWPLMIAFWWVLKEPGKYIFSDPAVYAAIQKNFFWIPDIAQPDRFIYGMPLINAVLQLVSMKITTKDMGNQENNPMNAMMYIFPLIILFSARAIPSGVFLYWMTGNIMSLLIRKALGKKIKAQVMLGEDNIEVSD